MRLYIFIVIIYSVLIPTQLSAKVHYIKVAETTSKSKVWEVYSKLNTLGLYVSYTKIKNNYIIYSGPYKNSTSLAAAREKINKYYPNTFLISGNTIPNINTVSKKTLFLNNDKNTTTDKSGLFIGASLGFDNVVYSYLFDNGSSSIVLPQKNGYNYGLECGYNFDSEFFATVGYLRANHNNIVFDNIYGSFNYKIQTPYEISPYFGIVAGYSRVTWDINPISGAIPTNNKTNSMLIGPQVGLIYSVLEYLSLYTSYEFLYINHSATLNSSAGEGELSLNYLQMLRVGMQISF